MPELPEVQTTVTGLRNHIISLTIVDVWTNYNSPYFKGSETIKDPAFFKLFKKEVMGQKIVKIERRAKNILIELTGDKTILIHMKMTGHLLFGRYRFVAKNKKDPWEAIEPEGLKDPFNKRIRFLITFDNGRHLALSDTRKFAKVTLVNTKNAHESEHLSELGPEPLEKSFTFNVFLSRLSKKPSWKIKQALMDQSLIAGIGNIYADESLWRACIHPTNKVAKISKERMLALWKAIKQTLSKGIDLGGDSMSDIEIFMAIKEISKKNTVPTKELVRSVPKRVVLVLSEGLWLVEERHIIVLSIKSKTYKILQNGYKIVIPYSEKAHGGHTYA